MVTTLSHSIYPERGTEEMVIVDSLGRTQHLQFALLGGGDAKTFFDAAIAAFAAQETQLTTYIAASPATVQPK